MNTPIDMHGLRVLIVEDDPQCAQLFEIVLKTQGAIVTGVADAEQAVELLEQSEFDAVATDIRLPGMSGIELLRHIRSTDAYLPVIITTAYSSVDSAIEALQLGAQDYLVKPLGHGSELARSLSRAIERRTLIQHNETLKEQLAQREIMYRSLFHNTSAAIFLHRLGDNGELTECLDANQAACSQLGYTSDELLRMTLDHFTAPERRRESKLMHATLLSRDSISLESVFVTSDNKRFPVELRSHTLLLNGHRFVVSLASDISERRQFERRLSDATESERLLIGRELHDVLSQDLASIAILAGVMKQRKKGTYVNDADIDHIRTLSSKSVSLIRNLCAGLITSGIENENLQDSLQQLTQLTEAIHRTSCSFECSGVVHELDSATTTQVYRIAQEALNNATRHSNANNIWISLHGEDGLAVLTIEDDGAGITQAPNAASGMGLSIMKHRANVIGAALDISPGEEGGTIVTCQWIQGNGDKI